jgi:hypothetical protein
MLLWCRIRESVRFFVHYYQVLPSVVMYAVSIAFSVVRIGSEVCDRTAESRLFQLEALRAWEARPVWANAAFDADVAFEAGGQRPAGM